MSRHKPLADEVKSISEFGGIVNAKRTKDFGHKALTTGTNVEVTDAKRLVRRNGYSQLDAGVFAGVYGTDAQDHLYAVKAGALVHVDANGLQTTLANNLSGDIFSWYEDPNNNVYFTSNKGSNGIVTNDVTFLPLSLPVPVLLSVGSIDPGTWEYRPFNLAAGYTASTMQIMATYQMPDGRESAPSEILSLDVAPEVKLLQVTVAPSAGCLTRIYATAPGGSTYYLVGVTSNTVTTLAVRNMNMTATGAIYEYPMSCASFPSGASLLCFYNGVLYCAAYDAAADQGVLYNSLPMHYHLFDMAEDFIALSSYPLLLLPMKDGIIIGTSTNIYRYSPEHVKLGGAVGHEVLTEVANYGVIQGVCGDVVAGAAYFWTQRGVARAMINDRGSFQFELLTEDHFSADPGVFNHAHVFHERGYLKLVASTVTGNQAFNQWQER